MRKTLIALLAGLLLAAVASAAEIERDPASRSALEPETPATMPAPEEDETEAGGTEPQRWAASSILLAELTEAKANVTLGLHPDSVPLQHASLLLIAHERISVLKACTRVYSLPAVDNPEPAGGNIGPDSAGPVPQLDIAWLVGAKANAPGVAPPAPQLVPELPEADLQPDLPSVDKPVPVSAPAPETALAGLLADAKSSVRLPAYALSVTVAHAAVQSQAAIVAIQLNRLKGKALATRAAVELQQHDAQQQAAQTAASTLNEIKSQFRLLVASTVQSPEAVEELQAKSQPEPEKRDEFRLATNRSLDDATASRGLEQSTAEQTADVDDQPAAGSPPPVDAPAEQESDGLDDEEREPVQVDAVAAAEQETSAAGLVEIPETTEATHPEDTEPAVDAAPEPETTGFMIEVAPDLDVPPPASYDLPDVADFDWPPKMPEFAVSPRLHEFSRGNRRVKQLALTFDDGPHPEYTSQLLEVLAAYDVSATFFFVGIQAKAHPQWVRETYSAGHELASQTYDHYRLPKLPLEEKVYQIDEYQRLIEGLVGMTPRFLRPPGGQLDPDTRQLLKDRGMVLALWDVATNDTKPGATREDILRTMKRGLRPGTVILAHDGVQATIDALPEFIEYARNRGYEFVTMSELAAGL